MQNFVFKTDSDLSRPSSPGNLFFYPSKTAPQTLVGKMAKKHTFLQKSAKKGHFGPSLRMIFTHFGVGKVVSHNVAQVRYPQKRVKNPLKIKKGKKGG